jgi:hypothetical protein
MTTPVFCATFKDGEQVRMTTHCASKKLDWDNGKRLAAHAWQTRDRRHRIEEFLANHDRYTHRQQLENFLAKLGDREPPEIASCHFDVDGSQVVQGNSKKEGLPAGGPSTADRGSSEGASAQ